MRGVDPNKRRAAFLQGVCSDSGVCIAFGKETAKIRKHFEGFISFQYLIGNARRIGAVSANGFVKELTYSRNGYSANAILKSSAKSSADNLYYEYLVGKYINKKGLQYPCFVETYGAFQYINTDSYQQTKTDLESDIKQLQDGMRILPNTIHTESLEHSCTDSIHMAVLIQNLKDAKSIQRKLKEARFVTHDLLYVLFQVYMPLANLCEEFTHYDLHSENILIYEPVKHSYIQYHYHMKGGNVVSFKSSYIAKIIDYGRCFFEDRENDAIEGSSKKIYETICSIPSCPNCGDSMGYTWLRPVAKKHERYFYYISSQVFNRSHDLRLLSMMAKKFAVDPDITHMIKTHNPDIMNILKQVVYKDRYGTPDKLSVEHSNKLHNVIDVANALQRLVGSVFSIEKNEHHYSSMSKLGDMYVYSDGRPLEFKPSV
jgi:hypothetical protein